MFFSSAPAGLQCNQATTIMFGWCLSDQHLFCSALCQGFEAMSCYGCIGPGRIQVMLPWCHAAMLPCPEACHYQVHSTAAMAVTTLLLKPWQSSRKIGVLQSNDDKRSWCICSCQLSIYFLESSQKSQIAFRVITSKIAVFSSPLEEWNIMFEYPKNLTKVFTTPHQNHLCPCCSRSR